MFPARQAAPLFSSLHRNTNPGVGKKTPCVANTRFTKFGCISIKNC